MQQGEALSWIDADGGSGARSRVVAFARHDGWRSVTNFGVDPVPMPSGTVVVASGPLDDGVLPGETTVWLA